MGVLCKGSGSVWGLLGVGRKSSSLKNVYLKGGRKTSVFKSSFKDYFVIKKMN